MSTTKTMVKLVGMEELTKALNDLGVYLDRTLAMAANAGADEIIRFAEADAPGPHIDKTTPKKTRTGMEIQVGPDKDHWYYQFAETGTDWHEIEPLNREALAIPLGGENVIVKSAFVAGVPAEPFLRPALDNNQAAIVEAVADKLREVIK